VVNSTDGVSGYQGEEGNHNNQALQTSHGCSAFYFEIFRLRFEAADRLRALPITPHVISNFYLPQADGVSRIPKRPVKVHILVPICCINKSFADSLAGA
jgi:hypothetical protein